MCLCLLLLLLFCFFFFFKQKTAYEMRISDWSSDVCSSDLERAQHLNVAMLGAVVPHEEGGADRTEAESEDRQPLHALRHHRRLPEQVTSKSQQRDGAAETADHFGRHRAEARSEEHTSELQSLMRNSYAVFCLQKKNK